MGVVSTLILKLSGLQKEEGEMMRTELQGRPRFEMNRGRGKFPERQQ